MIGGLQRLNLLEIHLPLLPPHVRQVVGYQKLEFLIFYRSSRLPTAPEALKTPTPRCGTRPTLRVQYVPSAAFSSLHRAQLDR